VNETKGHIISLAAFVVESGKTRETLCKRSSAKGKLWHSGGGGVGSLSLRLIEAMNPTLSGTSSTISGMLRTVSVTSLTMSVRNAQIKVTLCRVVRDF
jgi:hypothetical protein